MSTQERNEISVSVSLESDDFLTLLSADRVYSETGLSARLREDLILSLENSIRACVGDYLVSLKVKLGSLGTIIVADVLNYGGVQIPAFEIQLDTTKNILISSFRIEPPVIPGYQGYPSWKTAEPYIRKQKTMATRERHFIKFQGLFIPKILLPFFDEQIGNCKCPLFLLTPHKEPRYSEKAFYSQVPGISTPPHMNIRRSDYIIWICNCCGKKYTCECFRGVMEKVSQPGWQQSIPNYFKEKRIGLGNTPELIRKIILQGGGAIQQTAIADLKNVQYRNGICHFCRATPSTEVYRKYADPVIKHYLPYIIAEAIRSGVDTREAENRVRDRLGMPRIGEGWISETQLYHLICKLFPDQKIEREFSPEWLGRMRFDIFIPDLGLAIEYQGEQHYKPVERFSGNEGFRKTRERDKLKRERAKAAGIKIIEFKYDEVLTEEIIRKRITEAITH